jgi:hypothetical protein
MAEFEKDILLGRKRDAGLAEVREALQIVATIYKQNLKNL